MTRLTRTLALAISALALSAAAPARACDEVAPPPPRAAWAPAAHHGELRHEYRKLARARERFYATWNGNRGSQRRFERWYDLRRAELERASYRHASHRR